MTFQQSTNTTMASYGLGDRWAVNAADRVVSRKAEAALTIGKFVFAGTDPDTQVKQAIGRGLPIGLILNDSGKYPITAYLGEYTNTVPANFNTDVFLSASAVITGAGVTNSSQKVFASYIDGTASFALPGTTPADFVGTGYISTTTFTVSSTTSGAIVIGQKITGTGIAAETYIVSGTGPYVVSVSQSVGSSGSPVAINGANSVETNYRVIVGGADGALIKISA